MSMDPERPRKLAEELEALATEVVADMGFTSTAHQVRTTASCLRILADVLSPPPTPYPPISVEDVQAVADGLRNWATVYQDRSPQHFVLMEAASRVEALLGKSR